MEACLEAAAEMLGWECLARCGGGSGFLLGGEYVTPLFRNPQTHSPGVTRTCPACR